MRDSFNEINITPLTDIFLVLLIIMMVIAPMLDQQGLNLAVPEVVNAEQIKKDMLDTQITDEDTISTDTLLVGNWNFGEYWTERYIPNTHAYGVRAELGSYGKMVPEDKSYDDYDYSFIIFPDIQLMTNYNPAKLNKQIQWVADHKEERKIAFAFFDGDLSDFGQKEELYIVASNAMSRLDNIVPYCFVPGNHDYDDNAKKYLDTIKAT